MHPTANGSATRLSTWPRSSTRFTQTIGLERYAIYVFDYGAPVGLRLALAHPERITAIISQNGNAYEEGLSQGWNPIQKYWKEPTRRIALPCASSSSPRRPSRNTSMASRIRRWWRRKPTNWTPLCWRGPAMTRSSLTCSWITPAMSRSIPSSRNISAPNGRRCSRSGARAIRSFCLPGAEAFKRDNPSAEVRFYDTGHFALETHHQEIAGAIRDFLGRKVATQVQAA